MFYNATHINFWSDAFYMIECFIGSKSELIIYKINNMVKSHFDKSVNIFFRQPKIMLNVMALTYLRVESSFVIC